MKHVKLFESYIREAIDLSRAYPFKMVTKTPYADYISYSFENKYGTSYHVQLDKDVFGEDEAVYEYSFNINRDVRSNYQTDEQDSIKVFATVAAILKDAIENIELLPIPIHVKGIAKPGEGDPYRRDPNEMAENARDRIYKNIAAKETSKINRIATRGVIGYNFQDLGSKGFLLLPIFNKKEEL